MTTETVSAGWLMVALFLAAVGVGLIWFGRSAWSESRARKAEAIILVPPLKPSRFRVPVQRSAGVDS